MSDIVLVYPKTGFDIKKTTVDLPLGILSTAAVLVDSYKVKVIDQRINPDWEKELKKELKKEPKFVALSSMGGTQIGYALELSKMVKENSNAKVVWGGLQATLLPEPTIQHPMVDVVAIGEAEGIMQDLANTLSNGSNLSNVKGIFFKEQEKVVRNLPAEVLDVNTFPEIPYDLVDVEEYIGSRSMTVPQMKRTLPFVTSRGCPYQCTFCCVPGYAKRRWRGMSVDLTHQRVMEMVERFKLDSVVFHDENFLSNPKRAEELAKKFKRNFLWSIQARMDNINRTDMETLEKGGLVHVQPGIESGSERILKLMKKDETKEQMLEANRKLAKTSIIPAYNFMMGFPTETLQDTYETVDFALQLIKENPNAMIAGFYVYMPTGGTEAFELALQHGFQPPTTLEGWVTFNRQHQDTPWIQDKVATLNNVMLTSKLVDGKRFSNMFQKFHIPEAVYQMVGAYYRRKWRQHNFRDTLDIKALRSISRMLFTY
ncbi:B12-binding domain-containing radical SAM protein [Candidatus Woesearchaeota archaeon]|nr:B12-binding domain-containing radical SAM protein [Candidatus Woesearchaeota archaeon]